MRELAILIKLVMAQMTARTGPVPNVATSEPNPLWLGRVEDLWAQDSDSRIAFPYLNKVSQEIGVHDRIIVQQEYVGRVTTQSILDSEVIPSRKSKVFFASKQSDVRKFRLKARERIVVGPVIHDSDIKTRVLHFP
jgi:hypothetical protein